MTLNTAPFEDAIKARVETVTPRVFVSEVPADLPTPQMPYVILYFGGPIHSARDHHITSVRNDLQTGYCTSQVISRTDQSARDVNNLVRNALIGYRPPDCGEMIPSGGLTYSNGSNDVKPTKYYRESGYTYATNLGWND